MNDDQSPPEHSHLTRRRFLGAAGATAGATAASMALPPNVRKALAAPPPSRQPRLRDVEHVVLLMQENRSFDHYFGTLSGVAGFADPHAIRLPTGRSVFHQPTDLTPEGYLLPWHLDTRTTSAIHNPGTDHSWWVQHASYDDGKMDAWLTAHAQATSDGPAKAPFVMGYFDEQDLPFHRALADAFTICDRYHCAMLSSTTPNRVMWETGTIDPEGRDGGPVLTNAMNVNTWPTYAECLTDAGVSWKFYTVDGGMKSQTSYWKNYRDAQPGSPLYDNVQVGPLGQFEYDALNDRLPTVSWLFPGPGQNEHPNQEAYPTVGGQFIASKLDAIAANPDVWAKTVFILSYDENDGLFDHVVPPVSPPGTPDESTTLTSPGNIDGAGLPLGAGFRVPCIIVSPWTAGGWVCGEPFEHTSQLRFLERVTGVTCPTISDWRRRTFGDLTSAFRFGRRRAEPPTLPDTTGSVALTQYALGNLPAPTAPTTGGQTRPEQAPGRRPRTPRPRGGA